MNSLYEFWRGHGTKILGFAQCTLAGVVSVTGAIPEAHLKYWLMASGILTAWRGFFNSAQNAQS